MERFHLSLKSEAFRNVVPINIEQTQRICTEYKKYYTEADRIGRVKHRPHQGISGKIPDKLDKKQKNRTTFVLYEHLDGKITSFEPEILAAA